MNMKGKTPIILMAILTLTFLNVKAQESKIIFNHFDPPMTIMWQSNSDTLKMDFDQDGVIDFGICWLSSPKPWTPYFFSLGTNCEFAIHSVGDTSTIASITHWQHDNQYMSYDDEYEWGIRMRHENQYYYGWAYTSTFNEPYPGMPFNKIYIALHDIAFCTIPNYPLHFGQTSADWDLMQNEANYFASIHPNPTTGQVTITGKDLKQAEVFNALGQHVATEQGEGERMTVDISALPAGIYFVNVTDANGKKCVRKVVKQ